MSCSGAAGGLSVIVSLPSHPHRCPPSRSSLTTSSLSLQLRLYFTASSQDARRSEPRCGVDFRFHPARSHFSHAYPSRPCVSVPRVLARMDNFFSPALPSFDRYVLCRHSPLVYAISSSTTLVSPSQPRLSFLSGSTGRPTSSPPGSGSCSMMTASRHHLYHFLLIPVFSPPPPPLPPNTPSRDDVALSAPRLTTPTHTRLLSAPTAYGRLCLPPLSVIPSNSTST